MRSKLMPKGRLRIGSFYLVIFVIFALLLGILIGQVSFNLAVDFRLKQLESQVSPCEVTDEPYSEDNAKVEQMFDAEIKSAEIVYFVNDAERELIERVVMSESRGEPFEGMIAVAQTIKDRSDLWGMTPVEVVTKPSQYAMPYQGDISQSVKDAVAAVFDQGHRAFEEPTTHFATYEPWWASEKVNRGEIGGHTFWGGD